MLAWAVREGATNVIRHSGASHCTMRISAGLADAAVEVVDDGGAGRRSARCTGRRRLGRAAGSTARRYAAMGCRAARARRGPARDGSRPAPRPGGGFRLAVVGPRCRADGGQSMIRVLIAEDQGDGPRRAREPARARARHRGRRPGARAATRWWQPPRRRRARRRPARHRDAGRRPASRRPSSCARAAARQSGS